jgi:hypothetical protein
LSQLSFCVCRLKQEGTIKRSSFYNETVKLTCQCTGYKSYFNHSNEINMEK